MVEKHEVGGHLALLKNDVWIQVIFKCISMTDSDWGMAPNDLAI